MHRLTGAVLASSLSMAACAALGCSLATSWDGLPLDVAPDAAHDANDSAAAACVAGRHYCGGDGVVGDANTLYVCLPDGGAAVALPCNHGCARRGGDAGDACVCVSGSPYCGNDQIVGDQDSLYKCEADYSGTLVARCDAGCVVNANANDACR